MPRLSVTSCRPKRGKRCFKLCRPHTGSCERQRLHCEPVLGSDNKQLGLFPLFYAVESLFHLSAPDARGVRGELFGRGFGGFSFYRPDSKSPSRSGTRVLIWLFISIWTRESETSSLVRFRSRQFLDSFVHAELADSQTLHRQIRPLPLDCLIQ
jgi:hypothetical protein